MQQQLVIDDGHDEKFLDPEKFPQVDLPRFGQDYKNNDSKFRWTILEDAADSSSGVILKAPPKLLKIKTRGQSNFGLTALQLVFEEGNSPYFDALAQSDRQREIR